MVDECIRDLKRGKAAGHDDLTAEHLQNYHPLLMVLLSLLFNMIILYGIVPDDFGKGIIIPSLKIMRAIKLAVIIIEALL